MPSGFEVIFFSFVTSISTSSFQKSKFMSSSPFKFWHALLRFPVRSFSGLSSLMYLGCWFVNSVINLVSRAGKFVATG